MQGLRTTTHKGAGAAVGIVAVMVSMLLFAATASAEPFEVRGFESGTYEAGAAPSISAGVHPFEQSTFFEVSTTETPRSEILPAENVKDIEVELPPGLIGNAAAMPHCSQAAMDQLAFCPPDAQVGVAELNLMFVSRSTVMVPIYNLVPPPDEPAQFGFKVIASIVHVNTHVRSSSDYGVTATFTNINPTAPLYISNVHFWGIPASPAHDTQRFERGAEIPGLGGAEFNYEDKPLSSQAPQVPFLSNPTACGELLTTRMRIDTWQHPGVDVPLTINSPEMTECKRLPFAPSITAAPETSSAGSPAGMDVDLHLPQNEALAGRMTSALKKTTIELPKGVSLSPGSAEGLGACTDEQVGIHVEGPASCPESSKVGEVEIDTPLLSKPLTGGMYLGTQLSNDPTSGEMYRLFLVASGSGVNVKLPGSVVVSPTDGSVTATFDNTPQLPFEDLKVDLNGGPRAPLSMPKACGTYTTTALLTPWSAPTEPVEATSSFRITEGCGNASSFSPGLNAGTTNPVAGESSPFLLEVTGQSGQQNIQGVSATLPKGLLAKLAGVPVCADAQANTGSCDAGSKVGSTTVAAGEGSSPLYVPQPGKSPTAVYLAGPYKGAPYSLVFDVPAQAGPFDLGNVVVRSALNIDPTTTQVTASSDPLPQVVGGIPIQYRSILVSIDRAGFTRNPTNCRPAAVTSTISSAEGKSAHPESPFQASNCAALPFAPTLGLQLKGQLKRTGNPALTATLKAPEGGANIAKTAVILPKSMFIDQSHVDNPCTRVQFNANACPAKSILGTATAWSPLLDQPLTGPVYFRSNGGERQLPDLVADLNGQIHVVLVGFIDSVKSGKEGSRVRTRFQSIPDAPVSKFVLQLKGGKVGLIENSKNLCEAKPVATVQMEGQNGKPNDFEQRIATACGNAKKSTKAKH
jgi:hypothetical protein